MKKLTPRQLDAQYRVFSALSNLKRITILNYLRAAKGPVTAAAIEKATGISNPIIYEHVKALRAAGIIKPVTKTRNGPNAYPIELTEAPELQDFMQWLEGASSFKSLFKAPRQERTAPKLQLLDMAL